jgi:hypothetical protein
MARVSGYTAVVELTAEGPRLHTQALRWQQQCCDDLTAAWSEHDRHLFAGYLQRLADETTTYGSTRQGHTAGRGE